MSEKEKTHEKVGNQETQQMLKEVEDALLKQVHGGTPENTCGEDAGNDCWHDQCWSWDGSGGDDYGIGDPFC